MSTLTENPTTFDTLTIFFTVIGFFFGGLVSAIVLSVLDVHNFTLLKKDDWTCTQIETSVEVGQTINCVKYERSKYEYMHTSTQVGQRRLLPSLQN